VCEQKILIVNLQLIKANLQSANADLQTIIVSLQRVICKSAMKKTGTDDENKFHNQFKYST